MKGLLWVLTLFALAVGIALAARYDEGYVLLVLPPHRIEISLIQAMFILIGGFFALYAVLRGLGVAVDLPKRVREYREHHRDKKTRKTLFEAVRLFFEGYYSQSLKKAGEAHAAGQTPALAAMLAACSAQRLHDPEKQKDWLERAQKDDPKMRSACLMLEAEMHIDMHRYADAMIVLEQLHEVSGWHIAALQLELRAQQGSGNWEEVLRILHLLEKHDAFTPDFPPVLAEETKRKAQEEIARLCQTDPAI